MKSQRVHAGLRSPDISESSALNYEILTFITLITLTTLISLVNLVNLIDLII